MSEATITRLPRAQSPKVQSLTDRIKRLQDEAAALSAEQIHDLRESFMAAAVMASCVADNPAQPVGARDLCRRKADELDAFLNTLSAIVGRS